MLHGVYLPLRRGVCVLGTIATVIAIVLGVHIVAKFAFFALPYRRRRAELDEQYGDKPWATLTSDRVTMAVTVAIAVVLVWYGVAVVSFLGGVWIGATLIQLYFHRYHRPVAPGRAAPAPTSPLKEMSYAIQHAPWRPWPQILPLAVPVVLSFVKLA
jgi:heme/copper-type cytochrome/quinol oxidase subunit 2